MKTRIKKIVGAIIFGSGVYFLLRWWFGRKNNRAIILMYHRIVDNALPLSNGVVSATPEAFEQHMAFLAKHYNVVSAKTFAAMNVVPPKTVVITFDDGYADNYQNAFPILKKYQLPATIFLSTGNIESQELFWWDKVSYAIQSTSAASILVPGFGELSLTDKEAATIELCEYLKTLPNTEKESYIATITSDLPSLSTSNLFVTWDQVREMRDNDIDFGAHTLHHPILTRVSLNEARQEIAGSKKRIEEVLGTPVTAFAYPNGTTKDMSDELNTTLFDMGVTQIHTTIHGTNPAKSSLLKRIGIDHTDDMRMFRIKLLGIL